MKKALGYAIYAIVATIFAVYIGEKVRADVANAIVIGIFAFLGLFCLWALGALMWMTLSGPISRYLAAKSQRAYYEGIWRESSTLDVMVIGDKDDVQTRR